MNGDRVPPRRSASGNIRASLRRAAMKKKSSLEGGGDVNLVKSSLERSLSMPIGKQGTSDVPTSPQKAERLQELEKAKQEMAAMQAKLKKMQALQDAKKSGKKIRVVKRTKSGLKTAKNSDEPERDTQGSPAKDPQNTANATITLQKETEPADFRKPKAKSVLQKARSGINTSLKKTKKLVSKTFSSSSKDSSKGRGTSSTGFEGLKAQNYVSLDDDGGGGDDSDSVENSRLSKPSRPVLTSDPEESSTSELIDNEPALVESNLAVPPVATTSVPSPNDLLRTLRAEVETYKSNVAKATVEVEEQQAKRKEELKAALIKQKKSLLKNFEGNELLPMPQLMQMGYDVDTLQTLYTKENKKLKQSIKKGQTELNNHNKNIEKIVNLNKEAERAVTAAVQATNMIIVHGQKLKAQLNQVEIQLYGEEAKLNHRKNMRSVEVVNKSNYKSALHDVVQMIQDRSDDAALVSKILKVAGDAFSKDLGIADASDESIDSVDSVDSSSSDDEKEVMAKKSLSPKPRPMQSVAHSQPAARDTSSSESESSDESVVKHSKAKPLQKSPARKLRGVVVRPSIRHSSSSEDTSDDSSTEENGRLRQNTMFKSSPVQASRVVKRNGESQDMQRRSGNGADSFSSSESSESSDDDNSSSSESSSSSDSSASNAPGNGRQQNNRFEEKVVPSIHDDSFASSSSSSSMSSGSFAC